MGLKVLSFPKQTKCNSLEGIDFCFWRDQMIPSYRLADLLDYNYPVPGISLSKALLEGSASKVQSQRLIVLRRGQEFIALEVDHLVTETGNW